jgi:ATP-binding cassette subfamily B protein
MDRRRIRGLRSWARRGATAGLGMASSRFRLLRLLPRAGARPALTLVGLHGISAAMPALHALAVGHLVATLGVPHTERQTMLAGGLVAGLMLTDQTAWLFRTAVRAFVAKRIDGNQRIMIRSLAASLPDIGHLESPEFHDTAARAVDNGVTIDRTRSAGTAAVGQLELTFRMTGALSAAALLATFSWLLAALLLVVSLGVRAMVRRQWMHLIDIMDADLIGQRKVFYLSELAVTGAVKDVRLFDLGNWLGGRFRSVGIAVYGRLWRELWAVLRRQWWTLALVVGSAAAATGVPAAAVLTGRLGAAELITYVLAAWGIFTIASMGHEAYDIEYGLRGVQAADELGAAYRPARTDTPTRPAPPHSAVPPTIRFEEVSFTYPGAIRPTLDGLSLSVRPGETLAVVGENGVGKTTFVKLMGGLYRPDSGRITVDGVDLAESDPASWRRRLAVLFQDFVQYPATLRDNVALGASEHLDDNAVVGALRQAEASYLLDRLPDGLDTLLWREGAGGTDLSGGQWQRVALARVLFAVAAGRQVLVLDEPTAHLDVRAEAQFHERIVRRVAGVTTVLISHRLSTVRPASRIVVLRDGRIAEDGTHDDLVASGGEYARFFAVQAETFTSRAGDVGLRTR